MQRMGASVLSHVTGLGDTPHMEKLIGPVKVMLDAYMEGQIDALYLVIRRFVNTMKQEPVMEQLLPLMPARHWAAANRPLGLYLRARCESGHR